MIGYDTIGHDTTQEAKAISSRFGVLSTVHIQAHGNPTANAHIIDRPVPCDLDLDLGLGDELARCTRTVQYW